MKEDGLRERWEKETEKQIRERERTTRGRKGESDKGRVGSGERC